MGTHGMMWQFLLSLSNSEALLMKGYAVTLETLLTGGGTRANW